MKTERELAELIFDKFREANSRENHIIMMGSIRFGLLNTLNPKEQDVFFTVLNGLIYTDYIKHKSNPKCLSLTKKGFDYIYDDDKINILDKKPWLIPNKENVSWDSQYNKLWRVIGVENKCEFYIKGPKFYSLISELHEDLPPTYSQYIEKRKNENLSSSRSVYYKDLIDLLDDDGKIQFYINIQSYIENEGLNDITDNKEEVKNLKDSWGDINKGIDEKVEFPVNEKDDKINVFVTYAWEDENHNQKIISFVNFLRKKGYNATMDRKESQESTATDFNEMMIKGIQNSNKVIVVLSEKYKEKADSCKGGVGVEFRIIFEQLKSLNNKFIFVCFGDTEFELIKPIAIGGRDILNLKKDQDENNFNQLFSKLNDEESLSFSEVSDSVPKIKKQEIKKFKL